MIPSPKIKIINHFDNLINNVDIAFEQCIEKCNEKQVLCQILKSCEKDKGIKLSDEKVYFNVELRNSVEPKNNICPESTNAIDYFNQIRIQTIEELRKAQDDCLEYYKLNSSTIKSQLIESNSINQLFPETFYFQIKLTKPTNLFSIYTFVTDFYMSLSDINSLE